MGTFCRRQKRFLCQSYAQCHWRKVSQKSCQVALRYLLQRDIICIPKSVRKERMEQNLNVFNFNLPKDDMAEIGALDTKQTLFFSHRDPAFVEMICQLTV